MRDLMTKRSYLTTLFLTGSFLLIAQAPSSSRAYQIKAAFLFNFCQFVDWPPEAFSSNSQPLVIGVLGTDPFGTSLKALTRNESVNGRPLTVTHFATIDD